MREINEDITTFGGRHDCRLCDFCARSRLSETLSTMRPSCAFTTIGLPHDFQDFATMKLPHNFQKLTTFKNFIDFRLSARVRDAGKVKKSLDRKKSGDLFCNHMGIYGIFSGPCRAVLHCSRVNVTDRRTKSRFLSRHAVFIYWVGCLYPKR